MKFGPTTLRGGRISKFLLAHIPSDRAVYFILTESPGRVSNLGIPQPIYQSTKELLSLNLSINQGSKRPSFRPSTTAPAHRWGTVCSNSRIGTSGCLRQRMPSHAFRYFVTLISNLAGGARKSSNAVRVDICYRSLCAGFRKQRDTLVAWYDALPAGCDCRAAGGHASVTGYLYPPVASPQKYKALDGLC